MSDYSNTPPLPAQGQEIPGHGRHRGPVSGEEHDAAPHGRHRKDSEWPEPTGTAA